MANAINRRDFTALLNKALEIEMAFESEADWQGYIANRSEELSSTLLWLMSESEQHEGMVRDLISKVKDADDFSDIPARQRRFDFREKSDEEIMAEIAECERLALGTYSEIRDALSESDSNQLIREGQIESFKEILTKLIEQEKGHVHGVAERIQRHGQNYD